MARDVETTSPAGRTEGSDWSQLVVDCSLSGKTDGHRTVFLYDHGGSGKARLTVKIARTGQGDIVNMLNDEGVRELFHWLATRMHRMTP